MNQLFSPDENESEPVGTRPRRQATDDLRQIKGGKIMSNNSERKEGTDAKVQKLYDHGFFTATEVKELQKHGYFKAEDEEEDSGEDEDEDSRIRAAFPLIKKAMKRAANYQKSLKDLGPDEEEGRMEDQHKYATKSEDEDKSEDKAEDRAEDQQKLGPGQLGAMNLNDEERRVLAEAEKIILDDKKAEVLGHANVVLERQEKRRTLAEVERAKKLFEAQKNEAGVKFMDEQIVKLKAELAPQVATSVQGAQVPGSNPTILSTEQFGSKQIIVGPNGQKLEVKAAAARPTVNAESFASMFNATILPALQAAPRLRGVSEEAWGRQTRRLQ